MQFFFFLVVLGIYLVDSFVIHLDRVGPYVRSSIVLCLGQVGPHGLLLRGCALVVSPCFASSGRSSFLLTETLLFFLDFFCILVRSYMLQNVLVLVLFHLL